MAPELHVQLGHADALWSAVMTTPQPAPAATTVATGGSWLPWLVAAAGLFIAAVGWMRPGPTPAPAPPTAQQLVAMDGTEVYPWADNADGVTGDVVWHQETQQGYLRLSGLAANDPTQMQYQLWIFDASEDRKAHPAIDGGVFDVASGTAVIPIDAKLDVDDPFLFAVTTEPPGGVVEHVDDEAKGYRIVITADPKA